ncbi:MAG: hypothetical protein KKA65_04540 [Nanoarchaeota archaeon]|nr:hypothetical protein [Nanoarchaeota archaeon]MBU4351796.1 hypothetical protein [Nanoarchaeota archaeon]MBU4456744.1 hypothetical protein [Nanoarchaeota archaeon]
MLFRNLIIQGLFVGLVATLITTMFMVLLKSKGKAILDLHLFFGKSLLHERAKDGIAAPFALILHLMIGSLLGLGYVYIFKVSVLTGIIFAVLVWLVMMLGLFPLFKKGIFGNKLDKKTKKKKCCEFKVWHLTLIFHLIYGIFLGFFAAL